jgi:outer membrane receptor protein involved in Fe transport
MRCVIMVLGAVASSELVEEERSMVMDWEGNAVRSLALILGVGAASGALANDPERHDDGSRIVMPWEVEEDAEEPAEAQAEAQAEPSGAGQAGAAELPAAIAVGELRPAEEPEPEQSKAHQRRSVEEIVVTARKREESLQDVPVSVTAFSASDLERRGFSGLDDIAAATPGFTFEAFLTGGAHGNPVIRGLSQQFTTARIQNVSFFLDGVYLQRQSMLNVSLIDMQRVEVLKGPQNALYGRSAFAGAVNYVTLEPTADAQGYLLAGTGDNERQDYRISLAGPINGSGTLLGKVTHATTTRSPTPIRSALICAAIWAATTTKSTVSRSLTWRTPG